MSHHTLCLSSKNKIKEKKQKIKRAREKDEKVVKVVEEIKKAEVKTISKRERK